MKQDSLTVDPAPGYTTRMESEPQTIDLPRDALPPPVAALVDSRVNP